MHQVAIRYGKTIPDESGVALTTYTRFSSPYEQYAAYSEDDKLARSLVALCGKTYCNKRFFSDMEQCEAFTRLLPEASRTPAEAFSWSYPLLS